MNKKLVASAAVGLLCVVAAAPASAQFGALGGLMNRNNNASGAAAAASALVGAATAYSNAGLPDPGTLRPPTPIQGTAGKFMSPFTSDGVTAGWVTKSMQVQAAGAVGSMAGSYAGDKVANQAASHLASAVPIPGMSFLAQKAGKAAGQAAGHGIALQAIGGEAFLKSSTDLSFNTLEDMAVFMYANYYSHADYQKIAAATAAIYPEFPTVYQKAIQTASRK